MLKVFMPLFREDYSVLQNLRTITSKALPKRNDVTVLNRTYPRDDYTNITEKICSYLGRNIYLQQYHPLSLVRQRIINYMYKSFVSRRGNPLFSVYENFSPVVSIQQNFESLLIPEDHPSRQKCDCYYINKDYLLRAHMTAFQSELMQSGLNNFLMIGDVYRRDEIDRTHYPVFHQIDAVRLRTKEELFHKDEDLSLFEEGNNTAFTGSQEKQSCHTLEAVKLMEYELKTTLLGLAKDLFGQDIKFRWIDTYFPFTQPSWELEIFHGDNWLELLGCGIMKQPILTNSGVTDKIGWAFGLGLERIAMCLYKIPDIRLFWSKDSGFLNQFKIDDLKHKIIYKPVSQYPQCPNDISFWLPEGREYASNDFYDLVRAIGGDMIEQVVLVDEFKHPKTGKISHCYRIVYRHMERTLSQDEVNVVHKEIEDGVRDMGGEIR